MLELTDPFQAWRYGMLPLQRTSQYRSCPPPTPHLSCSSADQSADQGRSFSRWLLSKEVDQCQMKSKEFSSKKVHVLCTGFRSLWFNIFISGSGPAYVKPLDTLLIVGSSFLWHIYDSFLWHIPGSFPWHIPGSFPWHIPGGFFSWHIPGVFA